jgi:HPt (histidine-containing phosphotransfer) domain-containing protein
MENRVLPSCEEAGLEDGQMLPRELVRMASEGEADLASEIFTIFQSDTASRLELLSAAVESGDAGAISKQAHALKGSAGQIGADCMAGICLQMEQSAREMKIAEARVQLGRLQLVFAAICRAMSDLNAGNGSYGG